VVPEIALANTDEIRRDLQYMVARWGELGEPVRFEIRAIKDGITKTSQYAPDWIDEAVAWIERLNELGHNIYAVRNPIRESCTGSASDSDIVGSFFLWADCDDTEAANNVHRFAGPKWTAAIVTGTVPATRVHTYWELAEPCLDMAEWRALQVQISQHFGSDSTVVNPSRIMRVAGTASYPAPHKIERGYIKEVSTFRDTYEPPREAVTMDQMRRVFGESTPAQPSQLKIDVGPQPLDRERAKIQALSGQEWHHAIVKLTGSYVAKGLSDDEIHSLTDPLTLPGYTIEQTRAEVQKAVDGARAKGWTPEPQEYAAPDAINFDAPAAPVESAQLSPLEWFDDIEPALTDSYLVKGVIAQQSMSVVYGPSNSGKTFFALDLAFAIANGGPWRKHRVSPAAVLYLAAEGGRGVANRIVALKAETGLADVPLALRRAGMDLLHDQADLQRVYDLTQEVQARAPDLPLLIVIDTLSRVMAGGDENSAADMTALIRNIDAIREATGAHVMLVHHTGKDTARGARGHSSLRAATDTEIEVQNAEDDDGAQCRAAMVTKQRDYQGGEAFAFSLKTVTLGVDQDGDEVTSCVVQEADSEEFAAAKSAKKGLGGNQKIVAETFDQMVGEGMATPNPGGVGMPEPGTFHTVPMADLRRLSMGKMAAVNPRSAFLEAWKALTDKRGLFCAASEIVWRTDRKVK